MNRKILSIILTFLMVVSFIPTMAFAYVTTETGDGAGVVPVAKSVEGDGTGTPETSTNVAKSGDTEYSTLEAAVNAVSGDNAEATIELLSDITLDGNGVDVNDKNIIIDGNGKKITLGHTAFNHTGNLNSEGLLKGSLTIKNTKFAASTTGSGYVAALGFNSTFDITLDGCTFENMYTGVYANPRTTENEDKESITIKNCTYKDTTWGYSIDDITAGSLTYDKQADVTFTNNTGITAAAQLEIFPAQVASVGTARYKTLAEAVAANTGEEATTIELLNDITLSEYSGVDVNGKNITINGNGKSITIQHTAFNHTGNLNSEGLLEGSLTVNNTKFAASTTGSGYVAALGFNSTFDITLDGCTFENMYTGVYANPRTTENEDKESITIKNCTYKDTTWGYSIDDITAGSLTYDKQADVIFENNTGLEKDHEMENFNQVASVGTARYTDLNTAITKAAENGTVKLLNDATLPASVSKAVTIDLNGHKITAKIEGDAAKVFTLEGEGLLTLSGEENAVFETKSGSFTGPTAATAETEASIGTLKLIGGVFSADPAAYLESGKVSVANTDSKTKAQYPYAVGDVNTAVKVAPAGAEAKTGNTEGKTNEQKTAMENAAATIKANNAVTVKGLDSVGGNEAVKIEAEEITSATEALKTAEVEVAEGATVTVYVQPYLDITVADAKVEAAAEGGSATVKELTLDIKPMVKEIASTASTADGIVTKADATADSGKTQNAVQIGEAKEVEVTTPVTITFALPGGFVTSTESNIYIKHQKDNGKVYVYTATVTKTGEGENEAYFATFTNPNGFSEFVVTATNPSVAKIGETGYVDLQAAVDAVENGGTIKIVANASNQTATVSRTVVFNVEVDTADGTFNKDSISAGKNTKLTITGTASPYQYSFKYSRPSSRNGGSNAVVEEEVVPEEDTPVATGFVDVNSSDFFYNPVLWAVEKDITNGVDDTHFAPNGKCSRAEIVTFLWRAAGSPAATTEKSFSDVSANSYYANAVAWAVENGITTGTSADEFSPNATCTRAQAVAFLARALKASADPTSEFTDVAADSYYASAVAWAKANGITTGTSADKFSPDDDCTRGQIVTFLYRAYEGK